MKKIIILLVMLAVATTVYAADLEDYPSMFISGSDIDVTIVVGDNAHSTDVIAATSVATSLRGYAGHESMAKVKLASKLQKSLKQNLIIVGNPCVNEFADLVMGLPAECLEDFSPGDSIIKLYENDGYSQILVAGYSDEGTLKAVDRLSKFDLSGDEVQAGDEELKQDDEKIEVNLQEEMQPDVECPAETCTVVSEECVGNDLVKTMECKYYIKFNRACPEYTRTKTETEENSEKCVAKCDGCLVGDNCLSLGEAADGMYCSGTEMAQVKQNGESCSANYECVNNDCVENECGRKVVEEKKSFIKKIIDWLKNLFS